MDKDFDFKDLLGVSVKHRTVEVLEIMRSLEDQKRTIEHWRDSGDIGSDEENLIKSEINDIIGDLYKVVSKMQKILNLKSPI